ncbi:hypothetical protein HDV05_004003 [Chytridiales sp. JEL 0842]|nr:hypothetical protein HDV05_004003 [Chytridiales sp. JEL 0842]
MSATSRSALLRHHLLPNNHILPSRLHRSSSRLASSSPCTANLIRSHLSPISARTPATANETKRLYSTSHTPKSSLNAQQRLSKSRNRGGKGGRLLMEDIETRIWTILKPYTQSNLTSATLDSHLVHDLHLDSLDLTTLVLEIEDEFNIEFSEQEFAGIVSGRVAATKVFESKEAI